MKRTPGLLATGIAVLTMAGLSLWAAPRVGDRVPVHWNLAGEVDRYGSRFEGLVGLPLTALGVGLLLAVLPRIEPRRGHLEQSARAYSAVWIVVMVVLTGVHAAALLTATGYDVPMTTLAIAGPAVLLLVLGNYLGKVRSNFFFGIRTPWTLSSEESWTRTHRLGGRLFAALGALVLLVLPLSTPVATWVLVGGTVAVVLAVVVYSYLVWRDDLTARGRTA